MKQTIGSFRQVTLSIFCGVSVLAVGLGAFSSYAADAAPRPTALLSISEAPISPTVDYNILMFDNLRLSFTGVVGLTYDDNINRSRDNARSGFYTTPRLRMGLDWPLTPNFHLGTSASVGYRYFFSGDGRDTWLIGLADDLSTYIKADFRLGQGVLRISDHYSRTLDDIDIGLTGARDYVLNRNLLAARYTMPLAPMWSASARISRRDTWTGTDEFEHHDNVRHLANLNLTWQVNPQLQVGPYFLYEDVDYTSATGSAPVANNDRETYEGGLNFLYRFPMDASLEGSLGYQRMDIDRSAFATEQGRGFAGRLAARFATSEFTDHTLSVTHNRNNDIISPFVNYSLETTYMYAIASRLMRDLTLRGDIALIDVDESDFGEDAEIWRLGVGATYVLGPKTKARVRYEYWDKSSDIPIREYTRNRVSLFLEYDF